MKMLPLPQNDVEKTYSTWFPMYKSLDYLADKANHVRLQEINLTYHVPAKLLAKIGISSLRLYAQANNLFVITNNKYDDGFPVRRRRAGTAAGRTCRQRRSAGLHENRERFL